MARSGIPKAGQLFAVAKRGRGIAARYSVHNLNDGLSRIDNVLRSMQADRTFVKAGLMGKAKNKPRRNLPRARIEDDRAAEFAKAHAAINPVLLGVLAHAALQDKARSTAPQPSNLELGIIHEFGSRRIPARPFIRPAFQRHRAEYLLLLRQLVDLSVYTGRMPLQRALGIIGAKMAADMKKYVTAGPQIPPPNQGYPDHGYFQEKVERGYHKANRRRRQIIGPIAPPRTLVDTGQMVNAITWAVILRSSGDGASNLK